MTQTIINNSLLAQTITCPRCNGTGMITKGFGKYKREEICPKCHGSGTITIPNTNWSIEQCKEG